MQEGRYGGGPPLPWRFCVGVLLEEWVRKDIIYIHMDHQNDFERVADFRCFLRSWALKNETTEVDLRKFLGDRKRALAGKIDQELVDLGALKVAATVTMTKGEDSITAYLKSEPLVVLVGSDPNLYTPFEKLMESLAKWTHMGSGFTVENIGTNPSVVGLS